jgi:hypothetical protein
LRALRVRPAVGLAMGVSVPVHRRVVQECPKAPISGGAGSADWDLGRELVFWAWLAVEERAALLAPGWCVRRVNT